MRPFDALCAASLLLASTVPVAVASAQSTDDIVSKGHVVERERGEPLVAVPQTLPADLENRSPNNLTIIVEPSRAGADGDSSREQGWRASPRDRRQ